MFLKATKLHKPVQLWKLKNLQVPITPNYKINHTMSLLVNNVNEKTLQQVKMGEILKVCTFYL